VACISNVASADVDMTGRIAPGPAVKSGLHSPGLGAEPLVNSEHDGVYHCSDAYSTIANVAGGLAIGNCPRNEELDVEDYGNGGEESGYFYGGYFANLGVCAWVKISEALKEKGGNLGHCSGGIGYEYGTFYSQINSGSVHDGYYVNNRVACEEYANVYPWGADSAAGPIRSVPPYTPSHEEQGYPALKWRYVTNNGKYVMVRDATVGGGEGNWVFVERSCLPASLPSASEPLPKPTATTGTPTAIATPNATLIGFVNPNGPDTKYFFEYGTTESYGSYTTTGDAGSGTTVVQEDAPISGLAPGTTYYFRIVASSVGGETFGGPVAFTTQPPPAVSTSAASEVQQFQAQLNGNVNSEGLPTHYYFEYGTTTSYGHTEPTLPGSETNTSGPVSVKITSLIPDTTYHYRIVAKSSAGTSDGEDQVFTTELTSKPSTILAPNGNQYIYYRSTNNQLYFWFWNASKETWTLNWEENSSHPMAGDPTAVLAPNGNQYIYYRSSNNQLYFWLWNASSETWTLNWEENASHPMAGNPTAVESSNGSQYVYYRATNNQLYFWLWNASSETWTLNWEENSSHPMAGEPSVVQTTNGSQYIYFGGTNGQLFFWLWNTSNETWTLNWEENIYHLM
jgi:hypothetical protein